jgi:Na+/melibiose symporter-like transporter
MQIAPDRESLWSFAMSKSRAGLLIALGVDNFGSGLFLPMVMIYVTRIVGLPIAVAGAVVAGGTVAGLAMPLVAGRLVDRVGALRVVVGAQVLQALGAVGYLAARGAAAVAVAAVLLAAGQQLFYSSLCALISDVADDGPKDRPFAVAAMVRSACFSLGGLAAGGLLSVLGRTAYRIAVGAAAAGADGMCPASASPGRSHRRARLPRAIVGRAFPRHYRRHRPGRAVD